MNQAEKFLSKMKGRSREDIAKELNALGLKHKQEYCLSAWYFTDGSVVAFDSVGGFISFKNRGIA